MGRVNMCLSVPVVSFIVALLIQKLHTSIIIYRAHGDQAASELRGETCLSLGHQSACIISQLERFTEPLGASHALLDGLRLIQL